MTNYENLVEVQRRKLKKALAHLEYSYQKILLLPCDPEKLDDASLEVWESFSARFSRVADIFLAQYLRSKVLLNDPAFEGSLRDFLNQAEKLGYIGDASSWMMIRALRNLTVHDYSENELAFYFQRLQKECPKLLAISLD